MTTKSGTGVIVILSTAPDELTAEKLARGLIEQGLAACVNAIPSVKSFYRWRGKIEAEPEIQLIIKTRPEHFDDVEKWLKANHPYEVPEIIALPAARVSDEYLQWVTKETG